MRWNGSVWHRISRRVVVSPGRIRLSLAAFFSILISLPILFSRPPAEDRLERFRRMSLDAEAKGLAEPFQGPFYVNCSLA